MTPEISNTGASQIDLVATTEQVPQSELQKINELFDNNPDAAQQMADKLNFSQKEKKRLDKENDLDKKRENFLLTMEENISKQTTTEQISYYKQFLNVFETQLSNGIIGDPQGALVGYLPNLQDKLLQKEQEIILITSQKKEQEATKKMPIDKKAETLSHATVEETFNTEGLRAKLTTLSEKDFVEFKNVLEALKNGKIGVDQMDSLNTMTQIIKEMAKMDKTTVLGEFDKLITEKFPTQKNNPELVGFKDILSGLLDKKQILQQFGETIDRDLRGLSYDQLLEQAKDPNNLESADVEKSINTIFHMDKGSFDQLFKDFDDPAKQLQVNAILNKYHQLSGRKLPEGGLFVKATATIVIDKVFQQVPCFKIQQTDGSFVNESVDVVIDNKKETQQRDFTIYFGELDTAQAMNFSQVSQVSWVAEALGIDATTKMKTMPPQIQELMKTTITTKNGPKNMRDSISALFTSPFFDQLKQAFFSLMATFADESEQERYAIEANYVIMKTTVRQWGTFLYTDKDQNQTTISYIEALNKFEPGIDKNKQINYKQLFTVASVSIQKSYIETCMTKGKAEGYAVLESNIALITKKEVDKTQSNTKEFISGNIVEELKINDKAQGKVEKRGDEKNPYLIIDGKIVALIDGKGSLFVKGTDGKIVERIISITKDQSNVEQISITNGEPLDMGLLEKIKKEGSSLLVGLGDAKRIQLGKYYMLEKSIDDKENMIDILMKGVSELGPDQRIKAEIAIVKFQKEIIGLSSTLLIGKISDNPQILTPFKNLKTELSSIVTANASQQEKRNATIDSRNQNWSS